MAILARWCFHHRKTVLLGWLVAVIAVVGAGRLAGSNYESKMSLPHTDSQEAVNLLKVDFPAQAGESDQIVLHSLHGTLGDPSVENHVKTMLAKVSKMPYVESISSPYSVVDKKQVSRDGTIAFATMTLTKQSSAIPTSDISNIIHVAQAADSGQLHVALNGRAIENTERGSTSSSLFVGIFASLLVLLLVFSGALFASLLPILTALVALIVGLSAVGLFTHLLSIASFASTLSLLIGLGVGVDYGLFITSRHRLAVRAGRSYEDATVEALNTSGRTVLFAGITVCIALLGLFVLGVSFLYGVALAAAFTVVLTMVTALTLLPAMFGFLGPKVLSRRERRRLVETGPISPDPSGVWLRWARFVEGKSAPLAALGLVAIVVVAIPLFTLRLGSSDAGSDATSQTTRQAYDLVAKGFGPGFNGPFTVAGEIHTAGDVKVFEHVLDVAAHTKGVSSVTPAVLSPSGKAAVATLYPDYSPQAAQTGSLVHLLRNHVIPTAEQGSTLEVHLGGTVPTDIDFAHVLSEKLPVFIVVVVLMAFLLLMIVFRSILIPLTASLMNLLAVGASLGILNAVFEWGWGDSLLSISRRGPVEAFIPVLMFAILFGLSMDYEVFLVSRMHEEWEKSHDNQRAVTIGQANSGRVITAAATIMIFVFGSFIFGSGTIIKEFGLGLAAAVVIDAFIVRTILVPSLMQLFGRTNWWLPKGVDRLLPNVSFEGHEPPDALPTSTADQVSV